MRCAGVGALTLQMGVFFEMFSQIHRCISLESKSQGDTSQLSELSKCLQVMPRTASQTHMKMAFNRQRKVSS